MSKAYLVCGKRSPFGSFLGNLQSLSAPDLAAPLIQQILKDTNLNPDTIEEVILGEVLQAGVGQAPARQAMLLAGLNDTTPAMTINKVCGSGLKAIMLAADQIRLGEKDLIIAGGMESMSNSPHALGTSRTGKALGDQQLIDLLLQDSLIDPYSHLHMGELTEERITANNITREELDTFATKSYQLALAAQEAGRFQDEICPITVHSRKGNITITEDEEPSKVRFDKITTLRPAFTKEGKITAANASTLNDGAAVVLVASTEALQKYSLTPLAEILAYEQSSIHPSHFSEAPTTAMEALAKKAGVSFAEIDLFEINEAFAAVPLMAAKKLKIPLEKINPKGGAVSIGHPLGASGARLALTLALELKQQKKTLGMASLCIGGGEAVAMLLKTVG